MEHYTGDPRDGGQPTPERAALHDRILHDAVDRVQSTPVGEKPIAIMTMGAPASGKSAGLRSIDTSKFVVVDPDGIKERLPEYRKALDPKATYTKAAAMVHEESSHVAKQITAAAVRQNKNVIIDGTGVGKGSMLAKMEMLKAAGYHVHLTMSDLPYSEGSKRAEGRAAETGRMVPAQVLKEGYRVVPKNFLTLSKKADTFQLNNARRKDSPVVWSKGADGEHVHDPAFVHMFKKEHGD